MLLKALGLGVRSGVAQAPARLRPPVSSPATATNRFTPHPRVGRWTEPVALSARGEESNPAPQNQRPQMSNKDLPTAIQLPLIKTPRRYIPKEWKLVALRECPAPEAMQLCDTPERAAAYWRENVEKNPYFDPERECLVVLILNIRRRVRGHQMASIGTMDTLLVHPRDVFRLAIHLNAAAVICMHNHPSGDATPSDADIRVTRDLIKAGQLLKIELLDHVVMGAKHCSLRAQGFFA